MEQERNHLAEELEHLKERQLEVIKAEQVRQHRPLDPPTSYLSSRPPSAVCPSSRCWLLWQDQHNAERDKWLLAEKELTSQLEAVKVQPSSALPGSLLVVVCAGVVVS